MLCYMLFFYAIDQKKFFFLPDTTTLLQIDIYFQTAFVSFANIYLIIGLKRGFAFRNLIDYIQNFKQSQFL